MLAFILFSAFLADTTARPALIPVAPAESLWVVDVGNGDPVVLIPGLLGAGYEYHRLAPLLVAGGHRAIVVEPLGVGRSGRPAHADYSLTAQAHRLSAALDSLGVSGAIIVAHSIAASIALRLATERPDLVRAIVSLEGGVAESATTPGFRRAMKLAPVLRMLGVEPIRGMLRKELVETSGDAAWVSDSVILEYTVGAALDLGATLAAYRAMGRSREPEPLAPELSRVRCPFLLLLGAAPHASGPPPEEIALLEHRLPDFTADTIPGVGHFPQEEAPGRVAAAVDHVRTALAAAGAGSQP